MTYKLFKKVKLYKQNQLQAIDLDYNRGNITLNYYKGPPKITNDLILNELIQHYSFNQLCMYMQHINRKVLSQKNIYKQKSLTKNILTHKYGEPPMHKTSNNKL